MGENALIDIQLGGDVGEEIEDEESDQENTATPMKRASQRILALNFS